MHNDPSVVALVTSARDGNKGAWYEIVERYAPLVWSICRRYRLDRADAEDVGQSVWLGLVEQLPRLREPAALPGWIATTTRRECLRLLRLARRREPVDTTDDDLVDEQSTPVDQEVLAHERGAVLRQAFAELPQRCQRLLSLLIEDP
ncbi:MAG TPA: sigma-70 family RNA polymerase sigma factor, partial [Pilimelia sp.]|nr:sigma-70 family RNA polymerase sigma factor [Pilimelia sp.]